MMRAAILRLYAALLYAYPPDLRRTHGAAMRQCAADALAGRGLAVAPRLFADLLLSVPREWGLVMKGIRVTAWFDGLGRDVVFAFRLLSRSPGFTAAAVLTLALGIGANAAIFSLADAALLRPLKVANPSELYMLKFSTSYPDFVAYSQLDRMFSGVAAISGGQMNVVADGRAELVGASDGRFVSGNYFGMLGVPPAAGRVFGPSDDVPNAPAVAVLGYRWWQSRFGGDPGVIGRTIRINNTPVTIAGVSAEGFHGNSLYESAKVFVPITHSPRIRTGFFSSPTMLTTRRMVWLNVLVRLRPGVTPQQAAAAVEAIYRQAQPLKPGARAEPFELQPLRTRALGGANAGKVTNFVVLLCTVVALTLLIGCANLANLLLSRAAARRREIGVRMAIGAGRVRIARQLLIESLMLSTIGGAAGVYVASMAIYLLERFQLPGGIEIARLGLHLSLPVLLFTAGVSALTGLLFGVIPALRASRTDVLGTLREESRATSARSGARATLVAIQVALSAVLLIGTGLFLRSLVQALGVPLGFRVEGVATASVNLGAARYDAARARAFYGDALTKVRQLPGVTAAAWTGVIPSVGSRMFTTTVDGYQPAPDEEVRFYYAPVGAEYFKATGTRIVRGRAFTDGDVHGAPQVAIVNEAAAKKYWAGRDPLAGRIVNDDKTSVRIVGVAEDAKVDGLTDTAIPFIYLPFTQDEDGATRSTTHLLVRTTGDVEPFLPVMAEQLRSLDRDAPVFDVSSLAWRLRDMVMPQRMGVTLFAVFSALAVALSAVGIYGVASYVAALRTRELGIRIALGADRRAIRALVLRQASVPIVAGLAAGLLIAAMSGQAIAAFLRDVPPRDPITYAAVTALLASVALAATWIPARRAAQMDPIQALRQD
jgi:putative ABC transport system permease protein